MYQLLISQLSNHLIKSGQALYGINSAGLKTISTISEGKDQFRIIDNLDLCYDGQFYFNNKFFL